MLRSILEVSMVMRKMEKRDFEKVREIMGKLHMLHVQNRPDLYTKLDDPFPEQEYLSCMDSDNHISILAEENEEIMGICLVSFREKSGMVAGRTAYMDALYVREKFRGQGTGERLFQYVLKEAKERGANRLDLMVWDFNQQAVQFYQKMNMRIQRSMMEIEL